MKAKDFRPYINYALSVEFNDLDFEYDISGSKLTPSEYDNSILIPCSQITLEERDAIWEKEVIEFDLKSDNTKWYDGSGKGPKILVLTVSRFSEEERQKNYRNRQINALKKELESLSGQEVELK